ncbi:MAG: hypothetical protein V4507_07070 [Verrucomicrobiota bacterium]
MHPPSLSEKIAPPIDIRKKWAPFYQAMRKMRARLIWTTEKLKNDLFKKNGKTAIKTSPISDDVIERETHLRELSTAEESLIKINEALSRIEKNVYGIREPKNPSTPEKRLEEVSKQYFVAEPKIDPPTRVRSACGKAPWYALQLRQTA